MSKPGGIDSSVALGAISPGLLIAIRDMDFENAESLTRGQNSTRGFVIFFSITTLARDSSKLIVGLRS